MSFSCALGKASVRKVFTLRTECEKIIFDKLKTSNFIKIICNQRNMSCIKFLNLISHIQLTFDEIVTNYCSKNVVKISKK